MDIPIALPIFKTKFCTSSSTALGDIDMHSKKVENVMIMSGKERFAYFARKVADFRQVWGLFNQGWAMGADEAQRAAILFWPEEEFAAQYAKQALSTHLPKAIDLDEFMERWVSGMKKDNYLAAVFPTPAERAVFVAPEFLSRAIEEELEGLENAED